MNKIQSNTQGDGLKAEDKFKPGDNVKDIYGEHHVVQSVNHPMVYTDKNNTNTPGGGIHHTKMHKTTVGNMEVAKLQEVLQLEIALDAWWRSLTPKEKKAYLTAHPMSKYGKATNTASPMHKQLEKHGFVKQGNVYKHKNGRTIKIKSGDGGTHKHHLIITHKNGDVTHKKTNSNGRAGNIIRIAGKGNDKHLKYEWKRPSDSKGAPAKKPAAKLGRPPRPTPEAKKNVKKWDAKKHGLAKNPRNMNAEEKRKDQIERNGKPVSKKETPPVKKKTAPASKPKIKPMSKREERETDPNATYRNGAYKNPEKHAQVQKLKHKVPRVNDDDSWDDEKPTKKEAVVKKALNHKQNQRDEMNRRNLKHSKKESKVVIGPKDADNIKVGKPKENIKKHKVADDDEW